MKNDLKIFEYSLNNLMKELDKHLQEESKKDYLLGCRSYYTTNKINFLLNKNYILVHFGNKHPSETLQLVISYKNQNEKILEITNIETIHIIKNKYVLNKNFTRAYTNEILCLIGAKFKGKTEKEIKEDKLMNLCLKKEGLEGEINYFENKILKIKQKVENVTNELKKIRTELNYHIPFKKEVIKASQLGFLLDYNSCIQKAKEKKYDFIEFNGIIYNVNDVNMSHFICLENQLK